MRSERSFRPDVIQTGLRRPLGEALHWHVHPEFRSTFEPWLRKHWPGILNDPTARLKADPAGVVVQADGFVLKEYRKQRGLLSFGHPSSARRAYEIACLLQHAGVPIPAPVAWCVRRRFGFLIREYLVTQMISNAQPLNRWLAHSDPDPQIMANVLRQWGQLLALFHSHGFSHRDLKDENLLVTPSPDGPRLSAVDLDAVTPLRFFRKWRFQRDFWPILRSLLLLRLFDATAVQNLLEGYHEASPHTLSASDLPRILKTEPLPKGAGLRVRVRVAQSGIRRENLEIHLYGDHPVVPYADLFLYWVNRLDTLKPIRHSARVQISAGRWPELGLECHFKRYPAPSAGRLLTRAFGASSAAERAKNGLACLASLGLKVPTVRVLMEGRRGIRPLASALVCETVPGTPFDVWWGESHPIERRRQTLGMLACELATIHRKGFSLPRLKLSDVLVCMGSPPNAIALAWSDADDLIRVGSDRVLCTQLAKGMIRAGNRLTACEMRRFWRAYVRAMEWPPHRASRNLRRLLQIGRSLAAQRSVGPTQPASSD